MVLKALSRGTSRDGALETVRNAILNNLLKPGTQLKQSEIANQLGVSQSVVRESLSHLAEEGLVESVPFKGMFVRRLTTRDVEEIYQLRACLESLAARLALPHLRQSSRMGELKGLVARIAEAARAGDRDALIQSDLDFHRYIVKLSGNSRLLKTWESLLAQSRYLLTYLYAIELAGLGESLVDNAANHKDVMDSLESADISRINGTIEEHMHSAALRLMEHWEEISVGVEDARS